MRNRLFRTTEEVDAPPERIHMRFLYVTDVFAFPVFPKNNVKIFYCYVRIFMHSVRHLAFYVLLK